jgi:tetratricopeptide (TPR) repeat protein
VVLVERVTEQLLGADGSARTPQLTRTAALSTRSPAAMGLYLEGERHLRAGRHARALESFRDAVLQDSSFALANLRLSIAATWAEPRLAMLASEEAVRWSRGLPPLDSMLILAWRQYQTGDPADAERLYRAVLAERPHDVEAWDQLAELLFHWGPTLGRAASGSRAAFEQVLHYEPANVSALLHLARIAAHDERTEALDTLAGRVIRLEPTGRAALEARALVAYTRDAPEERAAVLEDLAAAEDWELSALVRAVVASVPDPAEAVGLLALMKSRFRRGTFQEAGDLLHAQVVAGGGRFATATEMLAAIAAPETNWAREYEAVLATLPFTPVPERELRALREQTAELSSRPMIVAHHGLLTTNSTQIHPPNRLFLLGLLELRLGNAAATLAQARQLDALVPLGYTDAADLARVLRAAVQQARGQPRQALATLGPPRIPAERSFPVLLSYPGAVERWLRAELLNSLGRHEEALRWYATFPDPAAHDLIWAAPAHFRQAQIHARRGETALAKLHDRRFLALWRHADPALQPWVREARERSDAVPGVRRTGAAERRPEPRGETQAPIYAIDIELRIR